MPSYPTKRHSIANGRRFQGSLPIGVHVRSCVEIAASLAPLTPRNDGLNAVLRHCEPASSRRGNLIPAMESAITDMHPPMATTPIKPFVERVYLAAEFMTRPGNHQKFNAPSVGDLPGMNFSVCRVDTRGS